jgi:Arc/MetJ-type ribon-helix-helix transcriptional regulator
MPRKRRIQTTISDEAYRIIERLKEKYGNMNAVIEEALRLLERKEEMISEDDLLLIRLIRDLDFTGCGKTQYLHLVKGEIDKAITNSMMEIAVEWFLKKPFNEISLLEFLETLKRGWKILNRADYIEVKKEGDCVFFLCEHSMRSREVSEFLCKHVLFIYEKYYSNKWGVNVSVSANGFTMKFYQKS